MFANLKQEICWAKKLNFYLKFFFYLIDFYMKKISFILQINSTVNLIKTRDF